MVFFRYERPARQESANTTTECVEETQRHKDFLTASYPFWSLLSASETPAGQMTTRIGHPW
jgi:hypothetical protein